MEIWPEANHFVKISPKFWKIVKITIYMHKDLITVVVIAKSGHIVNLKINLHKNFLSV